MSNPDSDPDPDPDPDLGKIDRTFFDEYIYPHLGADRDDVVLAPQHGVDFGTIDADGTAVVVATDPVFIMPSLGFERAAWFAFHILMSDVAVSGLTPTHLSIDLNLPPQITDAEFETVWSTIDEEASDLGVSVVTGHTARYEGCNYPMVGGATAIAVGEHADLVRPDGAQVGDRIVITNGPAVEATGLLSIQFASLMREELSEEVIEQANERFYDMSPVRAALTAAAAGPVTAMHDATECGVYGGLYEIARAAGVGLDIDQSAIPVQPGVQETCDFFDIDPWASISEGTLIAAVQPDRCDDVVDALDAEGIPAADVGQVIEGEGVIIDDEPIEHPGVDPFWGAMEEYAAKLEQNT
ncbi:AIR synthase family protein [Halocatena marina]|uniref:AIR synthase family protein n=1 Tax=Halocatena marina TaxID=2934937 RepID=A0ABD5YKQ6_9EURY|nr:AIR synthase family protein [Halocatena marina]